jgi:hypothetical protein
MNLELTYAFNSLILNTGASILSLLFLGGVIGFIYGQKHGQKKERESEGIKIKIIHEESTSTIK